MKIKTIDITPLKTSIAELSTKVDNIELRLDRTEDMIDKLGNNDNPLARELYLLSIPHIHEQMVLQVHQGILLDLCFL